MAAVRVLVGLSLLLVGFPRDARALPAFARRFNLACGACHSAVPRLNAFGEAFHENGFKPPGTMKAPLPATWQEAVTGTMAVCSASRVAAAGPRDHTQSG